MDKSKIGYIAQQCWKNIPNHFNDVKLDAYIIMPNHIHGIIKINKKIVGAQNFVPLHKLSQNKFQKIIPRSIGSIIRGFKIGVTKKCRKLDLEFCWQRNYYEHIVRNNRSLSCIRNYIQNNPTNWQNDRNNI